MKRLFTTAAASALLLAMAACGSNEDAARNAPEAAADDGMNAMMADPDNPFAEAEMQMNGRMMSAVGVNAADSWVRQMIEHHRGAIQMSRALLRQNPSGHVAQMAQETIDKQTREIAELEKLIQQGQPDPQSARLYHPAMTGMHNVMMAAKGADPADSWTRKMLEHHRGGVAMTDVLLRQHGVPAAVRRQAEKIKSEQQKDIAMLERMLRDEPMGATAPPTTPAAEPRKETARAEPKVSPKPPAKPAPKPEPADPHAGHDMNNMQ